MKQGKTDLQEMSGRRSLDRFYCTSGLLLSIACCVALIHVEFRIQEQQRLISQTTTVCDKMETEILRKVQQNFKQWGGMAEIFVVSSTALKINNVKKEDGGTYVCRAKKILGNVQGTAQLVVFSRLRFKVRPPMETTPKLGYPVRLPCVAESKLSTTVTWLKDGNPSLPVDFNILRNNTLVIDNVKNSHVGSYTCRASNTSSTIEASVEIKTPTVSSCSVARKYISGSSGSYVIDPDGNGGLAPFTVYCDMSDKNGVGVTVISHDSESRTLVDGLEEAGSYTRNIHYSGASFPQLASLTDVSKNCIQFIKYECYGSVLLSGPYGWWVSRLNLIPLTYWHEVKDLIFYFKCRAGYYTLPIKDYVKPKGIRLTRHSSDQDVLIPECRTKLFQFSYFNRIA